MNFELHTQNYCSGSLHSFPLSPSIVNFTDRSGTRCDRSIGGRWGGGGGDDHMLYLVGC